MEYPEKIYATEKVGTNGITCLDYRNFDEDVEYIRADCTCESKLDLECSIDAVCAFVRDYETRKYEIMHDGGELLSVNVFMVDYCQRLRYKSA